jgi:hypothetical protein
LAGAAARHAKKDYRNTAKQMTLDQVSVTHTVPHTGDGPADFSMRGTQLLLVGCSVTGEATHGPPSLIRG